MYFDAVVDHQSLPICNGTPKQIKEFLENRTDEENALVRVFEGERGLWFTVEEYLAKP